MKLPSKYLRLNNLYSKQSDKKKLILFSYPAPEHRTNNQPLISAE